MENFSHFLPEKIKTKPKKSFEILAKIEMLSNAGSSFSPLLPPVEEEEKQFA